MMIYYRCRKMIEAMNDVIQLIICYRKTKSIIVCSVTDIFFAKSPITLLNIRYYV